MSEVQKPILESPSSEEKGGWIVPVFLKKPPPEAVPIQEEWRPCARFPEYEVSNMGALRRTDTCVASCLYDDALGYVRASIYVNKKNQQPKMHQLVTEAFRGLRPSSRHTPNHLDGCKHNNWAINLEWASPSEQNKHAERIGLRRNRKGDANPAAKITPDTVRTIRSLYAKGDLTQQQIGERFGITQGAVHLITSGKHWSHLK